MTAPERQRLTTTVFYTLYPETNTPVELIEGEVIVSPSAVPRHQDVMGNIYAFLRGLAHSGARVFVAPLDVQLDEENSVQPDVFWIAPGRSATILDKRIEGMPDLMVEVVSPGSVRMDRVIKFRLYERFGAREYWIVDPEGVIEVFALRGEKFELLGVYEMGETFQSPALGQPVPLAGLFA
ncbi:MAG TPA: Uma2 family endonuclease [Candidatus Limnocylindrales bacterium]|nr:Uma2 family endonuclease [Candidatus Limnocylindrales bacterium]